MTTDYAIELLRGVLIVSAKTAGPMLLVALVVGLLVGILQAATQVNEASISFVTKLIAMGFAFVAIGGWTVRQLIEFTAQTMGSIANVVQ